MLVCDVQTARPRDTKDTAALRDVNFFSRFSIRICWDKCAVMARLPGGQTIVQPFPGLRLLKVSRQLIISERSVFGVGHCPTSSGQTRNLSTTNANTYSHANTYTAPSDADC